MKGRKIVEPCQILADMGFEPEMIDRLIEAGSFNSGGGTSGDGNEATAVSTMEAMLTHFEELDEAFRMSASCDVKTLLEGEEND